MPWRYLFELNAARARTFRAEADKAAGGDGSDANNGKNEEGEAAAAAEPVTLTLSAEQLTEMGLGDGATAEAVMAAVKTGKEATATLVEVQGKLATMQDAEAKRLAAELDKELADYDLDEETSSVIRNLSPEQRKPLLGKMPKKMAPVEEKPAAREDTRPPGGAAAAKMPPKPVHDPKGGQSATEMTPEAKTAEVDKLIAEIRKEGRFTDYTSARAEARRRNPELFS